MLLTINSLMIYYVLALHSLQRGINTNKQTNRKYQQSPRK